MRAVLAIVVGLACPLTAADRTAGAREQPDAPPSAKTVAPDARPGAF